MTSRKIAAFVLCACLLMIGRVFAQEPDPTPTETPILVPTDTPTNTDTPSPVPTDTATNTDTSTSTATDSATDAATSTSTASETSTATATAEMLVEVISIPACNRSYTDPLPLPTDARTFIGDTYAVIAPSDVQLFSALSSKLATEQYVGTYGIYLLEGTYQLTQVVVFCPPTNFYVYGRGANQTFVQPAMFTNIGRATFGGFAVNSNGNLNISHMTIGNVSGIDGYAILGDRASVWVNDIEITGIASTIAPNGMPAGLWSRNATITATRTHIHNNPSGIGAIHEATLLSGAGGFTFNCSRFDNNLLALWGIQSRSYFATQNNVSFINSAQTASAGQEVRVFITIDHLAGARATARNTYFANPTVASSENNYGVDTRDQLATDPGLCAMMPPPPLPAIPTPTPTPTGGVCPGGFLQGTQTVGVESCLPEPALYCMSRILTGVNLRSSPIFPQDTEPNNILQFLSGGSARLIGRFIDSSDVWLRVDGYADGSQLNTSVQGWIHLSAFGGIEPCASGSINDLPELDSQGNVISIPTPTLQPTDLSTPISTATATPTPIIVTPPPNPACTEAVTGQPVKLRSAPTTLSTAILNVDTYTPITIYWNSQGETINGSPVWLYTLINYGAPAQQYLGWIHSTLVDFRTCPSIPEATLTPTVTYTPSNTPTASNTPLPTATSTPTNTPPPDYSSQFLLPMIGTASNPPRLSNCLIPGYYDIPSRDINPRGITGGSFAVQTPARATIQIVDRIGRIPAPGIFVSIRVDLQDVPQVIRQRMATLNTTFGNIPLTAEGSLQIAYSHLTINSIPTDIEPVDIRSQILEQDVKPAGTIIGFSGDTGNTNGAHLDIAVYYIPDYPDVGNAFEFERWADPTFVDYRHNAEAFWSIYQVAPQGRPTVDFGTPIVVDPLVLWPILQEGTSCAFGN